MRPGGEGGLSRLGRSVTPSCLPASGPAGQGVETPRVGASAGLVPGWRPPGLGDGRALCDVGKGALLGSVL